MVERDFLEDRKREIESGVGRVREKKREEWKVEKR